MTKKGAKKKRDPRPRTLVRKAEAQVEKLTDLRERLSRVSPGGSPELAITVESAALVELRATRDPCPACAGRLRVSAHEVEGKAPLLVRRVELVCTACGKGITRWFRVSAPLLH